MKAHTTKIVGEGLTYDDVLLIPNYSEVLPREVNIQSKISRNITLNVPVVSATQTTRCLAFDTIVTINGNDTTIDQVKVGDKIQSNESDNIVTAVYHTGKQKAYKITLSNGQKIVCSGNHIFPTADSGDITINNGLKPKMYLQVKQQ